MNRLKQCEEIDRALGTLAKRLPGNPEAHERGRAMISALGAAWVGHSFQPTFTGITQNSFE